MTAFFFYAVVVSMFYYLNILLEKDGKRSPQSLPSWYLHLNVQVSAQSLYIIQASIFPYFSFY